MSTNTMPLDVFIAEVARIYSQQFGVYDTDTHPECWRWAYDDGLSPEEAVLEDLKSA